MMIGTNIDAFGAEAVNQAWASTPNKERKRLNKPAPEEEKINLKTMPNAMVLVTYGKKNTVWKNPFKGLMEFKKTAINKPIMMVKGTDTATMMAVLAKELRNS